MKTYMAKTGKMERKWVHVDATDKTLGRLAVRIATVLMGKHRPTYTPHVETGDGVIVTNVVNIRATGRKMEQKQYKTFSGYPSGLKEKTLEKMMQQKPEEVLRLAVRRMLPKGSLGNSMLSRLKIYKTAEHPHVAQKPEASKYLVGGKLG